MIRYGELVLIQWPRGYQPRALPLRHLRLFVFPRHVSIMWPPAHKAITIFKFGHLHVLVVDDGVLRRASAALQGILLCFRRRLAMTGCFCKATEGFYLPQQFLILYFLVCLKGKIHIDCHRIRTYDFALHCMSSGCLFEERRITNSAICRFCNRCLKWKYPNAYKKTAINNHSICEWNRKIDR